MKHPDKTINKYYYKTDDYMEYPIGQFLKFLTDKMISFGVEFVPLKVEKNIYRPHYNMYPYENYIIHMDFMTLDTYKIIFKPLKTLSRKQADLITDLFCEHNNSSKQNENYDVANPKHGYEYLTFQCAINDESIGSINSSLNIDRFIVQFRLEEVWNYMRKYKIDSII